MSGKAFKTTSYGGFFGLLSPISGSMAADTHTFNDHAWPIFIRSLSTESCGCFQELRKHTQYNEIRAKLPFTYNKHPKWKFMVRNKCMRCTIFQPIQGDGEIENPM